MQAFVVAAIDLTPNTQESLNAYVNAYSPDHDAFLSRHGVALFGAWRSCSGRLNRITHLYGFADLNAYSTAMTSAMFDMEGRKVMERYAELDFDMAESLTLNMGLWSPHVSAKNDANGARPAQYVIARTHVPLKALAEAQTTLMTTIARAEESGDFESITMFEPVAGRRGDLTVIGRLPSGVPDFAFSAEILGPCGRSGPPLEIEYISPLPYSPLQ